MAYFSNSTDGDVLNAQCERCPLGDKPCPILGVQLMFNYDQCDNPKLKEAMNNLIDEKGKCLLRPLVIDLQPINREKTILEYLEETT